MGTCKDNRRPSDAKRCLLEKEMDTRGYSRTTNELHVHTEERIVFESDGSGFPRRSLKCPVFAESGLSTEWVVGLKCDLPSLHEEVLASLCSAEEGIPEGRPWRWPSSLAVTEDPSCRGLTKRRTCCQYMTTEARLWLVAT